MAPWLIELIVGWLACAVASAGITFAYGQAEWPSIAAEYRRRDLGFALLLGLLGGPMALLVAFFLSGFCEHGWRLR